MTAWCHAKSVTAKAVGPYGSGGGHAFGVTAPGRVARVSVDKDFNLLSATPSNVASLFLSVFEDSRIEEWSCADPDVQGYRHGAKARRGQRDRQGKCACLARQRSFRNCLLLSSLEALLTLVMQKRCHMPRSRAHIVDTVGCVCENKASVAQPGS